MLSPSMYSTLWSLHCSMRIVHCWKQCCSCLLIAYSRAPSLLSSLHLVPFNTDLIFRNKKIHMGLDQVSPVDVPTWWYCASSKTSWQTGHCVLVHCLGEKPMNRSSTFQLFFFFFFFSSSPIHKGSSKPPCSRPGYQSDHQAPNPREQSLRCQKKWSSLL